MTIPVRASCLGVNKCRNDDERRYFERLDLRAAKGGWAAEAWPHESGHYIIVVCASDIMRKSVLRTLRADYVGPHLLFGPDETHQCVSDLDPARPGVTLIPAGRPEDLADLAANWFEVELARQIVREEWNVPGEIRERCVFADTGEVLTLRGKWNASVMQTLGPPDKRTVVWPRTR